MTVQEVFDLLLNVGVDFDHAFGDQCVDWAQIINRLYGAPALIGANACDIWNTYPQDFYDRVVNTPDGVPSKGSLIIWDGSLNGGPGHIAVDRGGSDTNTLRTLDQNWGGMFVQPVDHNYDHVLGWLVPKNILQTVEVDSATFTQLVTKSTAYDTFVSSGYSSITDVTEKISDLQKKLQDCTTDDTSNWEIVVAVAQQLGVTPNTNDKHGTSATLIGAINALKNPTSPKVSIAVTTTQAPKTAQTPNTPTQQAKPTSKFSLLGLIKSLFGLK